MKKKRKRAPKTKAKVRLTYINADLAELYTQADSEFLRKPRPCLLVVRLKFHQHFQDFAVPVRSNLNPKDEYFFPLSPRSSTHLDRVHAIQYSKMFPVERGYMTPYRFYNVRDEIALKNEIGANLKQIISDCQEYLEMYEQKGRPKERATNLDLLLEILNNFTNQEKIYP